jgi:SAM-dependent methyltransferase
VRRVENEIPDFSPLAASYSRGRPRYPAELFAWLAALVDGHALAWDCGTGNGQAALGLAAHFSRVVATDLSAEQLRQAAPHPRIVYRVAPAERSGLDPGSVDLVTAAAAAHWFDLPAFGAEVARVIRPGGVLAVFSYHIGRVAPPFQEAFHRFYWERMKPWFAPGAVLVDEGYRTLELPGVPLTAPPFEVSAAWTLEEVLTFAGSWSAVRAYREETGDDPLPALRAELAPIFGDAPRTLPIRMPIFLRVQRL